MIRRLMIATGLLASLSGCAALGPTGPDQAAALKVLAEHIEGCSRHYTGGVGIGAAFTFQIDCEAKAPPEPREPTPPPAL